LLTESEAVVKETGSTPNSNRPNRRTFLTAATAGGMLATISRVVAQTPAVRRLGRTSLGISSFELNEISITELQSALQSGRFTARSLVEKFLALIEAIDKRGPTLRSVIELNPDALMLADRMDFERREHGPRGPLHGIPVLVKDNIDTADRMATTAGSMALVGSAPPEDSFVVKRLRIAGAILLGKTNLSEWAGMRSKYSTHGWSGRGGQTINPYALDRSPCGSSSGSAVAVSANLCPIAVGTETVGSLLGPASVCGIVGIRPTVGRSGIIPVSKSQDTAGPMARTVRDAAILLGLLVGSDPLDRSDP
jgi:amidase